MSEAYLPDGLPIPVPEPNGLSRPFWEGLRREALMVQRNPRTGVWQWPPQWIAYDDQTFDVEWVEVDVRLTKDGHHILFPDDRVDEKTDGTGRVRDRTLAEIQIGRAHV